MEFQKTKKRSGGKGTFLLILVLFFWGIWIGFQLHQLLERKACLSPEGNRVSLEVPTQVEGTTRFIAIGDTGTADSNQKKVAGAIRKLCETPGCDFVLMLGDNFYEDGVTSAWDSSWEKAFEEIYQGVEKPFYAILGNHDVRGSSLSQLIYSFKSSLWNMPAYQYHFRAGPAQFFGLNSNCNPIHWKYLLDNAPSSSEEDWVFVFAHHPIFGSGSQGDADWPTRFFWNNWIRGYVDFYLSGHDHQLEHLKQEEDSTEYLVSGAGGKHYRDFIEEEKNNPTEAKSQFAYKDNGLLWVEVTPKEVKIRFYDIEGKILYHYSKKKPQR